MCKGFETRGLADAEPLLLSANLHSAVLESPPLCRLSADSVTLSRYQTLPVQRREEGVVKDETATMPGRP